MQNNCAENNLPCFGCSACAAACPQEALTIRLNAEGFFVASADKEKCNGCGLCLKVCPKFKQNYPSPKQFETLPLYAAWSLNPQSRFTSASGGIAAELAQAAFDKGYKPVGAVYDAALGAARTQIAQTKEEALKFKGSKYIQSSAEEAVRELENSDGKFIFFATPCQAAGLRLLARQKKFEDRLIIVDLFCHGVISRNVWKSCLKTLGEKYGFDKAEEVNFRTKKYGWEEYTMSVKAQGKDIDIPCDKNPFYALFLGNVAAAESCYGCAPRKSFDFADIRLGDFWGLGGQEGLSAAVALTEKGKELLLSLKKENKIALVPAPHEICLKRQACFKDMQKPAVRETVLSLCSQGAKADELLKEYLKTLSFKPRFVYRLKALLPFALLRTWRVLRHKPQARQIPQKVLQINGSMNCGGAETFLMNILRKTDREKLNFDFCLVPRAEFFYSAEIKTLGGNIYTYPFKTKKTYLLPVYMLCIAKTLLLKGPYRAVHAHYHFTNGAALFLAWLCGVKVRISHCHQNLPCDTFKLKFARAVSLPFIKLFATHLCACSNDAGLALYGKTPFTVIKNGIDSAAFAFNPALRAAKRKELSAEDNFVVLHSGRFVIEKNHSFLVEIFAELLKIKPNAVLLLAGAGALESDIKQKAKDLGVEDKVKFLGIRSDMKDILQAADCFVFPSVKEGLPVAGVEAQAAGLPCFFSDIITRDIEVAGAVFLPLDLGAQAWAERIKEISESFKRKDTSREITNAGFDSKSAAGTLEKIYLGDL